VEGDRDLLQELAGLFRDDWPRQLEALREASAAKDVKRIVAASHTLKGMLSNLTAVKAAAMAAAMEMAARRGECAGGNGELAKLEREIARVELALEGMCVEVRR
jgi:HPt (histidine-containing phosphotransfer) domain-containing protein